jgi:hypothetical protein
MSEELAKLAKSWRSAKARERQAMQELSRAIERAAQEGAREAEIVRLTDINRRTVRKAMGKQSA